MKGGGSALSFYPEGETVVYKKKDSSDAGQVMSRESGEGGERLGVRLGL